MKRIVIITAVLMAITLTLTSCIYSPTLSGIDTPADTTLPPVLSGSQAVDSTNNEPTSDSTSTADTTNNAVSVEIPDAFDQEKVLSQLQVNTYKMSNDFWHYAFIEITNNSEYDLEISANLKYRNADGNLIGADSCSENAIQSGSTVLFYTMPDEDFATIEYELSASEEDWYECVLNDLSYESVTASEKEIVTITNNGTKPAEFVECSMLFFMGDQVVGFDWTYFTDDDSEIKPGRSITKELNCYEDYDSYMIYFTGRRNK